MEPDLGDQPMQEGASPPFFDRAFWQSVTSSVLSGLILGLIGVLVASVTGLLVPTTVAPAAFLLAAFIMIGLCLRYLDRWPWPRTVAVGCAGIVLGLVSGIWLRAVSTAF